METNNTSVAEACNAFNLPLVDVSVVNGLVVVSVDVQGRSLTREAANAIALNARNIIRAGLREMLPGLQFSNRKFNGYDVTSAGYWNMGIYRATSVTAGVVVA